MQSHTCYCYVEYSVITMQLPQHCTCKRNTLLRTQLCRPYMNENSSTKVNTIHMKAKWFQPRIPSWHRDKYAADCQLVSSKYSYYKTNFYFKYTICQPIGNYWYCRIRFCGSLWKFCDCGVTITVLCNYYYECNTHLDRVRTIQCS